MLAGAPGVPLEARKQSLEALSSLYASLDEIEPGKGHAEKAAEWSAKLRLIK